MFENLHLVSNLYTHVPSQIKSPTSYKSGFLCSASALDIVSHELRVCDTSNRSSMGDPTVRHVSFDWSAQKIDTSVHLHPGW
jgi:hypothetical protein